MTGPGTPVTTTEPDEGAEAAVALLRDAHPEWSDWLPEHAWRAAAIHLTLLFRWNKAHNLTRVDQPREAAFRHYGDAWCGLWAVAHGGEAPVDFASGVTLDVGSGAGFPGIPCALAWPESTVVLLEPSRKRRSFLQTVARAAGVPNLRVVGDRAEASKERGRRVITRATLQWPELCSLGRLLEAGGTLVSWVSGEPTDAEWKAAVEASNLVSGRRLDGVAGLGTEGSGAGLLLADKPGGEPPGSD
jgi:16S rRNA (guanine527-N7)-methyltransferase